MRTADFDFELPPELIAQVPAERRDASRLLVLDRASGKISHENFRDLLKHLRPGDVLVLNNSRVIPARLRGVNEKTGGQFEVLLLEENSTNDWWVMLRPGKRARVGTKIIFRNHAGAMTNVSAEVIATNEEGHRRLRFDFARSEQKYLAARSPSPLPSNSLAPARSAPRASAAADSFRHFPSGGSPAARGGIVSAPGVVQTQPICTTSELKGPNILDALDELGELPLPPYIERAPGKTSDTDLDRYQTVFAQPAGSVAAPTAGLHFTPQLLDEIRAHGVHVCFVTLHVGLGTFAPVKADSLAEHVMHEERFEVSEATANIVNLAKREGRRVIAIGTTSVRVLESASDTRDISDKRDAPLRSGPGRTSIFIHPPHRFKIVDALLTNFHLPRSTLLMLVSAFAAPGELRGREFALGAYAEAVRERYRFFSYGDAMLIFMKRPFVLINMSMTADGKIATTNRAVSHFSSVRDRAHLFELRATADAVMCGARTVDLNEVQLGAGSAKLRRQRVKRGLAEYNLRVIVTGSGSLDPKAHIFRHRFSPIIILTTEKAGAAKLEKLRAVADEVKVFGKTELNLHAALAWLHREWKVKRLVCEGGGELNDAMFRAGLVDELHLTLCPRIIGGRHAPTIADGVGFPKLARAAQLELQSAKRAGDELFLVYRTRRGT